jgi:hypothetical protein
MLPNPGKIPPLRPLEPVAVEADGQRVVVLRDPLRLMVDPVMVPVPVYLLLCLMDGTRSISEVRLAFRIQTGGEVSEKELRKLVRDLDEKGLLETERFETLRRQALQEFRDSPVRKAAHAGSAYAADPGALTQQIDAFYEHCRGDGEGDSPLAATSAEDHRTVRGLVAPHIDPRVGGACAARAFAALAASSGPRPDLFVLLGTVHQPSLNAYALTEKAFETPLGVCPVDLEVARKLLAECSFDLKEDEYLHKNEHSIEFQVIFLQHLYQKLARSGNGASPRGFRILPILVGSFHEFLETNTIPSTAESVRIFTRALRKALDGYPGRVCFIAGADLSHMGRKFGDSEPLTEAFVNAIRAQDLEMLGHVERGSREEFFRHLQCTGDKQKVCGLPPIYTMMNVLGESCEARLLHYDLNVERATESFVSFASLVFYDKTA